MPTRLSDVFSRLHSTPALLTNLLHNRVHRFHPSNFPASIGSNAGLARPTALLPHRPLRIAVLSVSAGSGHVRAAQALCAAAPEGVICEHIDVMQYVPRWFKTLYVDAYLTLIHEFPSLWLQIYRRSHAASSSSFFQRTRRLVEKICTRQLRRTLRHSDPDVIICTHFLPAEMLCRLPAADQPRAGIWVQVTDYDLHSLWVQPGASGYFIGNDEIAARLLALGVPAQRIHPTGIPLMPGFGFPPARSQARQQFGLKDETAVALIMGGGHGHGQVEGLVRALLMQVPQLHILVACGSNEALARRLTEYSPAVQQRVHAFGFIDHMEWPMQAADFAIGKPGGLSSAECLALGLPLVVFDPIPGQEERNADYLLESGAALKANSAEGVIWRVRWLLADKERLQLMRARARAQGRPGAAALAMRKLALSARAAIMTGPLR